MKLTVTPTAADHFMDEFQLKQGDYVHFFVKYGGHSVIQTGFSLGISHDKPEKIGASVKLDDVTYYVEESDLWYFEGHQLKVDFNEHNEEIEYNYNKE
ncbi:HesB/YadR/YfhF family protein [Chengkuizengella axinellae]|uniref:HesB/YadR/YfhF family protein n=1 Tax=Chengkuizengella axinellae TaxID=3064388 RepID=A0ABT9J329_9BACL|nr:HesB/YadR/YfhF family protein [Chengkuizengella sp. 2205SS18-9]MDP5276019.1 HesB/YadR/YfhF family protein [Chengkuizengella sp. 2205SS18-9]